MSVVTMLLKKIRIGMALSKLEYYALSNKAFRM
jgi:hypothetical protein